MEAFDEQRGIVVKKTWPVLILGAIVAALLCIAALTARGARFEDGSETAFDDLILATGYRAAVGILGALIGTDGCGFARRTNRVVSLDQPDLYFVGHNYDTTGGLFNIRRDSRLAARLIAAQVAPGEPPGERPPAREVDQRH